MTGRKGFGIPAAATALLLTAALGGCYGVYHEGPPVYRSAYYYEPYHYYYYPSLGVYYHIHSGDYYYRRDNQWVHDRKLPPQYRLNEKDRVKLWMDDKRPWDRHSEHERKYAPRRDYKPDSRLDRREREHNRNRHEQYRRDDRHDRRDRRPDETDRSRSPHPRQQ